MNLTKHQYAQNRFFRMTSGAHSLTQVKKQKGISLMEIIFGLAVIAGVITGALSLSSNASTSQKSNQLASDLTALRSGTKQLYGATASYGSANINTQLINAGKLPATITNPTGTTLVHTMSGNVNVVGGGTWFYIQVDSIPRDACVNLLTGSGSWPRIKVGASAPTGLTEAIGTSVVTGPAAPAAATTACAGDTNTISFVSN